MTFKRKRRSLAGLLAALMCIAAMPVVASANEDYAEDDVIYGKAVSVETTEDGKTAITYEFDMDSDDASGSRSATLALDSTFTMAGTYHRGGDRAFAGNFITYSFTVSDTSGNPTTGSVTIEMYDYYHSSYLRSHTIAADAGAHGYTMSITPYRYYYFKYYKSSTTPSLKIRLVVYVDTI